MPPEEGEHWCSLQKPGNQAGHNFCLVAGEDKVHRGHSVPLLLTPSHQGITNNRPLDIQAIIYAGWWYTYPSENMKVSWDDNIWKNKKCSKAPTSTKRLGRSHDDSLRTVAFQREQHLTFTAQPQCPAPGKRIGRLPALQDSPGAAVVEESRSSRSSELITGIDSRVNKLDRKSKIYHQKLDDQFIDRFEK